MKDAVKRVLVAVAALQGLSLFSIPLWAYMMPVLKWIPDPFGTFLNIILIGALVWGAAEISNRLVGPKKRAPTSAANNFVPVGGLAPADLAVLLNAKDNLRRVRRAAARIADRQATASLMVLAALADQGLASLPGAPERLRLLRRPLEYHLPKVVELAEGLAAITHLPEQNIRAARIANVFTALAEQFRAMRDGLTAPDLRMLDVEIKLIENALKGHDVARMAATLAKAG
jgi:hypothetical protein